jgi:hypothetical protein
MLEDELESLCTISPDTPFRTLARLGSTFFIFEHTAKFRTLIIWQTSILILILLLKFLYDSTPEMMLKYALFCQLERYVPCIFRMLGKV